MDIDRLLPPIEDEYEHLTLGLEASDSIIQHLERLPEELRRVIQKYGFLDSGVINDYSYIDNLVRRYDRLDKNRRADNAREDVLAEIQDCTMYALGILNFSWLPHIQHRYFAGIDGSRMSWTVIECGSYTTLAESTLEACSNATEFILRPEDFDSPPFMRVAKDWMM